MPTPFRYVTRSGAVTWRVRFRHGGVGTSETFDELAQASRFARDVELLGPAVALQLLDAAPDDTRGETLTVADLGLRWLTWKATDADVRSDRTVADYRRDFTNWIVPTLGSIPAHSLSERQVQDWVDGMTAGTLPGRPRKLAPKSVVDRHVILSSIYTWATAPARRLVTRNPCVSTKLPRRRHAPPKGLRPGEWQALEAALRQVDPDAADLAAFMLGTGWRFSEATALSAYSVEDDGYTMHVTMGRVVRRDAAGRHVIVDDAKSAAGLRRVRVDTDLAELVRRRLDRVAGDGLVFTTRTGAQWHHSNFRSRAWLPAVKAANLTGNPTPHALRHTAVAWLVAAGASLPEIQRRIGHESIQTTIGVYGRMIDDVSDDALAGFAALRTGRPTRRLDRSGDTPN